MISTLLLPLAALLLPGCSTDPVSSPLRDGGYTLSRFSDCGEMKAWIAASWTEELLQGRYGYGYDVLESDGSGSSGGTPTSYSETNVQEAGVDEPDLVKTDGEFLYITHGSSFSIVKSWPAEETALLSTLDLDAQPFALFLSGDRAAVLASAWSYNYDGGRETYYGYYEGVGDVPDWSGDLDRYYSSSTKVFIVDISDRAAPELLREVDLEGWYTDARMIGADMYLVTNRYASLPDELYDLVYGGLELPAPTWGDEALSEAVMAEARALLFPHVLEAVMAMDEAELLPEQRDRLPGEEGELELLTECTDVYRPDGLSSPGTLALTHIDLAEGEAGSPATGLGLLSYGWEVYASLDNLYISQTSGWWWGWGGDTLETHVHKFELDGADTRYAASGSVQGYLLNNYSMSEHDGYLRMATTDAGWWWGDTETEQANHVFVLEDAGGELSTVGHLGGLAPGEQIYAMRFMGEVGYMVTFIQVDPLFTLDLSDPRDPRVVGELKIPGYSSYLHPAGPDHLLAVGMDGTEDGTILGFQVSLFDISDLAKPTLASKLLLSSDDWSYSEALWDPHAFTYFADTLSVPVYTYDEGVDFSGLWVLDVDLEAATLSEIGKVGHGDLASLSECPDDPYDDCYDYGDYAWMRRSVVIEDWLYSLSSYGIKVTPLRDPADEVATVLYYPR